MKLAFIGFGEAGTAFVEGLKGAIPDLVEISIFDIKTDSIEHRAAMLEKYDQASAKGCQTAHEAIAGADIIFSTVTADQALVAAKSVAQGLKSQALYFDCNSCAPDTKRKAASIINAAGGRYVDVAVMAPVHPALHESPVLICGPAAGDALTVMNRLNMSATLLDGEIGDASATKMVRSVIMKGMEALVAECILAGRRAGVDARVLASLDKTFPGFGWQEKSAYMLERMMVHGQRRAAEMREVAITVEQLGLDNSMSNAIIQWQQKIGDMQLDPKEDRYETRADAILDKLGF